MTVSLARLTFQQIHQSVSALRLRFNDYEKKVQSLLQQGRSISLQDLTEQKELSQQIEKCQTAFAQLRKTIRLRNEHLDPFTAIANEIEVTLPTKMQELDQEIAEGPDAWKRAIVSSIATGVAVSAFIYGLISLGKYIAVSIECL